MFTAKDAQLIQEVADHGVPHTDSTDNRLEDALRRAVFDMKDRWPYEQTTTKTIKEFGGSDDEFDAYAETLRKNKFGVQLEHNNDPGKSTRFHLFTIDWHYGTTGGKLY